MSARVEVPITKKVLAWALDESGLSRQEVADAAGLRIDTLENWVDGIDRPSLTQLKAVAGALHRQFLKVIDVQTIPSQL